MSRSSVSVAMVLTGKCMARTRVVKAFLKLQVGPLQPPYPFLDARDRFSVVGTHRRCSCHPSGVIRGRGVLTSVMSRQPLAIKESDRFLVVGCEKHILCELPDGTQLVHELGFLSNFLAVFWIIHGVGQYLRSSSCLCQKAHP